MQTATTNEINIFDLPKGKHSFTADVLEIREESEINYHGYYDEIPYLYLTNLSIMIDTSWYKVNPYGTSIKVKIGKKLQKLELEKFDKIGFDAQVSEIEYTTYEDEFEKDKDLTSLDKSNENVPNFDWIASYSNSFKIPANYDRDIKIGVYQCGYYIGLGEKDYKGDFTISTKKERIKDIVKEYNFKNEKRGYGEYSETQGYTWTSRTLKNLSQIEKF